MPSPLVPRRTLLRRPLRAGLEPNPAADASVKNRVRQWQAQGGGVVHATDDVPDAADSEAAPEEEARPSPEPSEKAAPPLRPLKRDREREPGPRTPRRTTEPAEPRTTDSQRRRSRRDRTDGAAAAAARAAARSVSAPRRRIVSDDHWRRERSPAIEDKERKRPGWTLPDDGIRVRPVPDGAEEGEREPPRRRRLDDDGIRVYSTEDPPGDGDDDATETRATEGPDVAATVTDRRSAGSLSFHSPTPSMRESEGSESGDAFSFDGGEGLRAPKVRAHDPRHGRRPPKLEPMRRTMRDGSGRKNSRAGILGHVLGESKKIFGKTGTTPVSSPQVPSIESWLNGTPDPFVDGGASAAKEAASPQPPPEDAMVESTVAADVVPPLAPSHRRTRTRDSPKLFRADSNRIWDALDSSEHKTLERRRRKVRESATPENNVEEEERLGGESPAKLHEDGGTGSTLRRRGARRKSTALPAEWKISTPPPREREAYSAEPPLVNPSLNSASSAEFSEPTTPLRARKDSASIPLRPASQHRLSTIASVDTLQPKPDQIDMHPSTPTRSTKHEEASEARDRFDPAGLDRRASKSRVTRHADLMSVLSMPRESGGGGSIRSARSVRTTRSRLDGVTLPELMKELAADEARYLRELRTLVDGVIPVLLTSILSKANSEATICLFSSRRKARDDPTVTKPIYDMGVALERLKRAHKRIPLEHADALAVWARGTEAVYRDYLRAWRMGFQDVIVNLAPAEGSSEPPMLGSTIDGGLPRDENGDVLGEGGERVDVAFLLKRPLVRLKYLSKSIHALAALKPGPETEALDAKYAALVETARSRVSEERARLEDEAAADVDATRARDLRSLAPLEAVAVDGEGRVRARDCFNLAVAHSSGQAIDCRAELILRDDPRGSEHGGDVLVCEVDGTGRWLLFPPVPRACVSARNGDRLGEVVVMVRGQEDGWHEILILQSDDEEAGFEWVNMLGLVPVPPQFTRSLSFMERRRSCKAYALPAPDPASEGSEQAHAKELEVPLGESRTKAKLAVTLADPLVPAVPVDMRARLERRKLQARTETSHGNDAQGPGQDGNDGTSRSSAHARRRERRRTLGALAEHPSPVEQRPDTHAEYIHRRQCSAPPEEAFDGTKLGETPPRTPTGKPSRASWGSGPDSPRTPNTLTKKPPQTEELPPPPPVHRSTTPAQEIPVLTPSNVSSNKARASSPLKNEYEPSTASGSESDSDSSSVERGVSSMSEDESDDEGEFEDGDVAMPLLPPGALLHKFKKAGARAPGTLGPSESASQAPYRQVPPQAGKQAKTIASIYHWSDKGSWELLHADECSVNVTPGLIEAFEMSAQHSRLAAGDEPSPPSSRASSANTGRPLLGLELTPLVPIRRGTALDISIRSPATADSTMPAKVRTANFMFRSRSPEECDALYALINHARCNNPTYIALQHARATSHPKPFGGASFHAGAASPGAAAAKSASSRGGWFGLGARGGSYRASSAPTPRASEPSTAGSAGASALNALRRLGLRSSRFSIARSTVTSRRGSRASGSVFSASDRSSSSGTSTPLPADAAAAAAAARGEPVGLTNAKIRMYVRETASKWRDLGQARVTIMRPGEGFSGGDGADGAASMAPLQGLPRAPASVAPSADGPGVRRPTAADKRIVVASAKNGATLLDVTLGESCFERVARTGIAVSVWEAAEDGRVGKRGGVVAGRFRVYMLQMNSEAETAYTFNIVGRLRY